MTNTVNLRETVLDMLMEITRDKAPSHVVLARTLVKYQYLDKRDRSFLSRLTQGTLEYQVQLDYMIEQFSSVKINKMKPVIRNILRMAVYQLKYMDSVPDSAACNEAVKLTVRKGFGRLKGFVNGVLRNIARNLDRIPYPDRDADQSMYLAVKYALPLWLVDFWTKAYGADHVEAMGGAFLEAKSTTVRCCNLEKAKELAASLAASGILVEKGSYLPYALKISGYDHLTGIEAFQRGAITVQDESSMLAVLAAGITEGQTVIDVCAAPGGKSAFASVLTGSSGKVYARDLTDAKVEMIRENIERMALDNVEVRTWDALVLKEEDICKADAVLADLPCSGLGILGKKPDIKWNMSLSQMEELSGLQRRILSTVSRYVKPGGTLVYSTCTVNPSENEDNVRWFTKNHPFKLDSLIPYLPKALHGSTADGGILQMIPGIHQTDGFFIARMKRIGERQGADDGEDRY